MEVENIMMSVEGVIKLALAVKNPPDNAGDGGDAGLIPWSGSSPGGGNGDQLQFSCLRKTPCTEEPEGLQSMGSQRVKHN